MGRRESIRKWIAGILGASLIAASLTIAATAAPAQALSGSQFDPGNIISDQYFYDTNAMSEPQIQSFLNSNVGVCTTGNCLNVLRVATPSKPAKYSDTGALVCAAYGGSSSESAADVIFKVQQACGISAKVILVTLQKEQGLVSKKAVTQGILDRAMGYGCPDSTGGTCASEYYGFFNQVYWGSWQLKRYGTKTPFGTYQPGLRNVGFNPNTACGGGAVNIKNNATAALYNYTPYQPNSAALANLTGLGDACSSYGNRNFWVYYNNWFGSTTMPPGTPEGSLDSVTSGGVGALTVSGWAVDPDVPTAVVNVSIQVDSQWFLLTAGVAGSDLNGRYPGAGSNHAFNGTIGNVASGLHTMCVYLGNQGAGITGTLGCRPVTVSDTSPRGEIKDIWTTLDGISLWGWAADQDAPSTPLDIRVVVNGSTVTWKADQPWAPIADLMPGAGINHGWGSSISLPEGDYSVCVYAVNKGAGSDSNIGCRTVTVPSASPKGEIKDLWTTTAGVSLWGWAIDPDNLVGASTISIQVDSSWYAWKADQPYAAAADFVAGAGNNHGWGGSIAVPPGDHSVCVYVGNTGRGHDVSLGCRSVNVPDGTPRGELKDAWGTSAGVSLWGWAIDPDVPSQPMKLSIQVDSNWYVWDANLTYAPAAAYVSGAGPSHGFGGTIPATSGSHTVCVYPINQGAGRSTSLGCRGVSVPDASPVGEIRGLWTTPAGISMWGWAIDPDALTSPVPLSIQVDGSWYSWKADQAYAPAQGYVLGAGPNHGWGSTVSAAPGKHTVCVYPVNQNQGHDTSLGCSVVTVPAS
ncbi:MAG: hypothetical protein H7201_04330 [Candidatus Saccharibacteria bacterium]|nr:hypothetical protein [Microbacteriaceae bacterium]